MRRDLELGCLGIQVRDPSSLTSFFGDVIGLVPGEPADGQTVTWRNDVKAHRIIVEAGAANDAVFVGFEATDASAFDHAVDRLAAHKAHRLDGSDDDRNARRVQRMVRTTSPWGATVEVVLGLEDATTPFASPSMPGGFLPGCSLAGEKVQDARTSDLVFSVPRLVAELSAVLPLLPGDVIFTGTPAGVGIARQPARFLQPGQVLESWIEGIGNIRNRCV